MNNNGTEISRIKTFIFMLISDKKKQRILRWLRFHVELTRRVDILSLIFLQNELIVMQTIDFNDCSFPLFCTDK